MSPSKSLAALTAALGLLGLAGNALAQTSPACTTDTDCQHGYTCQVTEIVSGTTPSCPPDSPCITTGTGGSAAHEAKDGGTATPTGGSSVSADSGAGGTTGSGALPATDGGGDSNSGVVSTISTCQPGPCTGDSDCAAGMICHGQTATTCMGSAPTRACDAGTKCDTGGGVTEPTCTTETVSICTFKWALPCNVNDDCGEGFVCQPATGGACSGGGGSPGAGGETGGETTGNSGVEVLEDSCTTTMTFPGYCRALVAACTTDADCPSVWTCQDNAVPIAGTGGSTASPGTSDGGSASSSGSGASPSGGGADVAPPENTGMCIAPNTAPRGVKDGGAGGQTGSTPSNPGAGTGGTSGGSNEGSSPTSGTGGTLAPVATAGGTGGATDSQGLHASTSDDNSGGCAVSPSGGSSGGCLLVFGGLALLFARRRRS